MDGAGLTRRRFIRLSAAGSGGLLLAFHVPEGERGLEDGRTGERTALQPLQAERFNTFLAIDGQGRATIRIPVPEIGQGVRTSLAMLVAEELDVEWDQVGVEQADAAADLGPHPFAGGSFSVRAYWLPLREAGGTARAALVAAAAERWGVDPAGCTTDRGEVVDGQTGRRLGYGELAAAAAARPSPEYVRLKDPSEFRFIGRHMPHLDTPAIVTGAIRFGLDTVPDGALRAVVARCPTYGGTVRAIRDAAALAVPGVRQVFRIDRVGGTVDRPYSVEGVAVVADSTWAAIQGRNALEVEWDEGPNAEESTERLHVTCRALIDRPGDTFREDGDVDAALATSPTTLEAVYHAPFLAHAPLEPMNCAVHVRTGSCEIWAPTQIPLPTWRNAAALLDLEPENVTVHVTRIGGAFGRRLSVEFVLEAIQVARRLERPVQVVWTREDDMRHGFFRPFSYHRLRAGLDRAGRITGWHHRQAGTSRYAFREGEHPGLSEFREGTYPAGLAPAHRLEYALARSNLSVGPLRAPGLNAFTFAVESFLDEVAHAAGRDPLALRLELLGAPRQLPYSDEDVLDTGRLARVLRVAADAAGWGESLPAGRGRGIGCTLTFGSYAAHVIEASVDPRTGRVTVHRVTGAIDCGRVVNPNGVRAQMQGGIIDGLGAALHGEITVTRGAVDQRNYADYPILRYAEAPDIDVHIIESDSPPSGAGEPPYPPVFPALANAIFQASGARVRTLPFRPEHILAALRDASPDRTRGTSGR